MRATCWTHASCGWRIKPAMCTRRDSRTVNRKFDPRSGHIRRRRPVLLAWHPKIPRSVRREMEVLVRQHHASRVVVQRAQIVLVIHRGEGIEQIARRYTLRLLVAELRKSKARFAAAPCLAALEDAARSGRSARISIASSSTAPIEPWRLVGCLAPALPRGVNEGSWQGARAGRPGRRRRRGRRRRGRGRRPDVPGRRRGARHATTARPSPGPRR